ncbi:MAG: ATP-binding cassette domain-containing protein [Chloroflexota bacterium]|nr:ATP-binding cassette domain-containing protein [Chloroflexota bacterium]
MSSESPLLEVRALSKHFPLKGGVLKQGRAIFKAVDEVSFSVPRGKTLGLVGESGSGKTTVGKCALRLVEPTAGQIFFDGQDITHIAGDALRRRRSDMQMIYQSPAASLNGRMTIGEIIGEPLWLHERLQAAQRRERVMELLHVVGLKPEHYYRFPHEFSGGQQQRVGIARALAVKPKLLVLDEPTSALDVSVQAQVLNLLHDLQRQFGLSYLFISHDLSVVRYLCDQVALLYLGKVVEIADVETIFTRPKHPYTQALISAIPEPDPDGGREQILLKGDLNLRAPKQGCPFAPRCHAAKLAHCETDAPLLVEVEQRHQVACHLHSGSSSTL